MSSSNRSKGDWVLHHQLVGQLAGEISGVISNTAKLELLEIIRKFKQQKTAEWAAATKQEVPARVKTGMTTWEDSEL